MNPPEPDLCQCTTVHGPGSMSKSEFKDRFGRMTKHLVIRGDHDAAGNIYVNENADGTFNFLAVVCTDDVTATITCGAPMTSRQLAALGNKLVRMAKKSKVSR